MIRNLTINKASRISLSDLISVMDVLVTALEDLENEACTDVNSCVCCRATNALQTADELLMSNEEFNREAEKADKCL